MNIYDEIKTQRPRDPKSDLSDVITTRTNDEKDLWAVETSAQDYETQRWWESKDGLTNV